MMTFNHALEITQALRAALFLLESARDGRLHTWGDDEARTLAALEGAQARLLALPNILPAIDALETVGAKP